MQHESGGWRGADVDAITFNDDAMTLVLHLLLDIREEKPHLAWVDEVQKARARTALERGVRLVLDCQVVVNGEKTVWAQQHDHETLAPRSARRYELPGLTARESVGVVRFLMRLEPTPEIAGAIEAAVRWFESAKLPGIRLEWFDVEPVPFQRRTVTRDVRVARDPDAPPLWARYYDLDTQTPFFADRSGTKFHTLAEVEIERRTGYDWYGDWPRELLETDYPAWAARHGRPNVLGLQPPAPQP